MIGWLWRFLVGHFHSHTWETVKVCDVVREPGGIPFAHDYYLRCTKCGDYTTRRL